MPIVELLSVAVIFFSVAYLAVKNFRYALYLGIVLSVLLHKELFSFYRWDLMPIRAFMLGIFIAGVWLLLSNLKKILSKKSINVLLRDPFLLSLLALWFIRGVSIIFTKNLTASVFIYGFFTTVIFLLVFMAVFLKDRATETLNYLKFFILTSVCLTLFGYAQLVVYGLTGKIFGALWNIPGNIPRVGTTFWDVNHFGSLLAAMIPLACVMFLFEKKKKIKVYYAFAAVSMSVTLLLTNSRTSWIMAFVTALFFITALLIKSKGFKGIWVIVLAGLLISAPAALEYSKKDSPFRAKIKQYFHYRMDSFDSHFMLLTGAIQIFEKYPIIGGGYGSFFEHFSKTKIAPTFFGRDPAALNTRVPAHTIWGELLAETGVLGLSAFVILSLSLLALLIYNFMTSSEKRDRLLNLAMASIIVSWLVAGIFYSYNSEFFWIIWGLFYFYGRNTLARDASFEEILVFFSKSKATYIIGITIIAVFLLFINLGKNHLIPWDEAIYAKIAKNMVVNNDYLVQTWRDGKVWYEKPPMYMWMMASSMKVMGFNSWAARIPGALFGLGVVLVTFLFANKLFGKTAGFFSALALITTTQFLYYARASMLDVTATFFIITSLYLYYTSLHINSRKRLFAAGVMAGFSVMVKGVVGLLPAFIIALYEIYLFITKAEGKNRNIINNGLIFAIGLLIISLPWHLYMYKEFGQSFISNYLGYHVWDRATSAIEDKGRPFFWYVTVMKVSMRLWFIVLIPALVYTVIRMWKKEKHITFIGLWMFVVFMLFSLSKSKLVWYIIPLYPAAAILVGLFVKKVFDVFYFGMKLKNYQSLKFFFTFGITAVSLTYLFLVKHLVYTSDLTGSEARLIQEKDAKFEKDDILYADRIELPLLLFYTDGAFEIIDFRADRDDRVPDVGYDETLVLLTKKGRFSEQVIGQKAPPVIQAEDGDYILWYFKSEYQLDKDSVEEMKRIQNVLIGDPSAKDEVEELTRDIEIKEAEIKAKLGAI